MNNINEQSIEEYFENLIEYHNDIFGVSQNATVQKINYIKKYKEIFSFIDLLKKIDEEMDNDFLEVILHDIVKLLQQRSLSLNNSYKTELSYIQFTNKYAIALEKDDSYKQFLHIQKKYQPLLDSLLNTKFFYFDKYICFKISELKKAQYFLGTKGIINMKSIMEYVNQDNSNSFMKFDYKFFGIDTVYPYEKTQINFIKQLAVKPPSEEPNIGIEQLIKHKDLIPFFENLVDEDIRDLITNVTFKKFKPHEPVIIERDTTMDIFFLLSGECKIMIKGEEIGTIPEKSIFGEFAFITKERRTATIKPIIDSVIISFNFDLYSFENNPCIYSKLYNNISNILVKKITSQNS